MHRVTGLLLVFLAFLLCGIAEEKAAPVELRGVVLTNDRTVDCTSNAAIIKGVLKDGMTEQQKALALWRFFIQRNMHKEMAAPEDNGNAAELMTKSAYGLCGNWGDHYAELAAEAGLTASSAYLNGHVVAAVQYWGGWHMFDADMWAIYPKPDGVVASPMEIRDLKDAAGGWLLRDGPPLKSYPWYIGPDSIKGVNELYAKAAVNNPYSKRAPRWTYDLRLRPGMEVSWSWYGDPDVGFVSISHLPEVRSKREHKTLRAYLEDDWDYYRQEAGKPKWNWGNRRGGLNPNPLQAWNGVNGNGRVTFPWSKLHGSLEMLEAIENLEVRDDKALALKDDKKPGWFVLNFKIPYPYGDAWITKPLPERPLPKKGLKIEISHDGQNWREVYPANAVDDGQRIRLFEHVRGKTGFKLRFSLESGAAWLENFSVVGAFHHAYTALPALLKGKNKISVRMDNPEALAGKFLHVLFGFDLAGDDHVVHRHYKTVSFSPDKMTQEIVTSEKHWPLMREIRMFVDSVPRDGESVQGKIGEEEFDWGAAPWAWCYHGVNFWNDFERGDRQGWAGKLVTKNTARGSDFALDNSLMTKDGGRQLKLIRSGAFLNRASKFRCALFVKNAKDLRIYTRNQADQVYFEKTFSNFKDGEWQRFEVAMNDLADPKDAARKLKDGDFLANMYLVVTSAEGKAEKDVEFLIDDIICYDGELKHDPFADSDAPKKALAEDPVWNAKPAKGE